MHIVGNLLNVPSTGPDDARRRKLLNILLLGLAVITLLGIASTTIYSASGLVSSQEEVVRPYFAYLATLVSLAVIFAINRHGPGWLASLLFVLLVTVVCAFTDQPQETVSGRSLIMLVLPIMMGSVILPSYVSFIVAGLSSLVIVGIGLSVQVMPSLFGMIVYFTVALVSWLSARSLERALTDLRIINLELDQRVADRTRDLAEALSKNQTILESIADGVIVFGNDSKATVANRAMARLLGRPPEEITGQKLDTLMRGDVDTARQEVISNFLRDKEASYMGLKFQWGKKTLSVSFAPILDNFGGVTGTVAVFRDFTREAELERMKSAFVSMVSHELRTPLNAILGYADMLKEAVYGPLSDKQSNVMERIMANAGRQLGLVNNLLDQAQIEAGKLTLKVTSFNPADLIDDVQGVMGVLAQTKGLELTSHITDEVPATLSGDRQRLHQILVNLVGNAIKFTEEGTVQVYVYRPDAAHWALEVSDTGYGIPPEAQSYIFDPFRQADDSVTRGHTGSGLGLSIVKQLTTLMGGEITLASEVGRGSTFTIVLPLIPTQEESP